MTRRHRAPAARAARPASSAKALLARTAVCELAHRRAVGRARADRVPSPVARTNCGTLSALMHERARFALRLPGPGQPVIHAQALRLQCGGLQGTAAGAGCAAARRAPAWSALAHERHGSLTELPWASIVRDLSHSGSRGADAGSRPVTIPGSGMPPSSVRSSVQCRPTATSPTRAMPPTCRCASTCCRCASSIAGNRDWRSARCSIAKQSGSGCRSARRLWSRVEAHEPACRCRSADACSTRTMPRR